jgi:hypothetical protein
LWNLENRELGPQLPVLGIQAGRRDHFYCRPHSEVLDTRHPPWKWILYVAAKNIRIEANPKAALMTQAIPKMYPSLMKINITYLDTLLMV